MALFDRIVFSIPPAPRCVEGQVLPLIEVQAAPGVSEEVRLVLIGGGQLLGTSVRRLVPNMHLPSVAYFDDIIISPPGTFQLEVRSLHMPDKVFVRAEHPIVIGMCVVCVC